MRRQNVTRAKELRQAMTPAELRLWQALRANVFEHGRFVRQMPIGPYIADFVCRRARLVVEVDGGQHAESSHDQARDAWLSAHGYRVLRFWNNEVLSNTSGVVEAIMAALSENAPSPHPSPRWGEGAKSGPG
ncbi:MAG: endonuclease domain-containing protein [Reyranellaceae bacterium]